MAINVVVLWLKFIRLSLIIKGYGKQRRQSPVGVRQGRLSAQDIHDSVSGMGVGGYAFTNLQ